MFSFEDTVHRTLLSHQEIIKCILQLLNELRYKDTWKVYVLYGVCISSLKCILNLIVLLNENVIMQILSNKNLTQDKFVDKNSNSFRRW